MPVQHRLLGGAAQLEGTVEHMGIHHVAVAIDGGFHRDHALNAFGARTLGIDDARAVHDGAAGIHRDAGAVGNHLGRRGQRKSCSDKPARQGQNSEPRGE